MGRCSLFGSFQILAHRNTRGCCPLDHLTAWWVANRSSSNDSLNLDWVCYLSFQMFTFALIYEHALPFRNLPGCPPCICCNPDLNSPSEWLIMWDMICQWSVALCSLHKAVCQQLVARCSLLEVVCPYFGCPHLLATGCLSSVDIIVC